MSEEWYCQLCKLFGFGSYVFLSIWKYCTFCIM